MLGAIFWPVFLLVTMWNVVANLQVRILVNISDKLPFLMCSTRQIWNVSHKRYLHLHFQGSFIWIIKKTGDLVGPYPIQRQKRKACLKDIVHSHVDPAIWWFEAKELKSNVTTGTTNILEQKCLSHYVISQEFLALQHWYYWAYDRFCRNDLKWL